jgi:hypothetical protein
MATISSAKFRLLCKEVAAKVNARSGRADVNEQAVLLELLRRVEAHLGRKPADYTLGAANSAELITAALAGHLESAAGPALASMLQTELLGKVALRSASGVVESAKAPRSHSRTQAT